MLIRLGKAVCQRSLPLGVEERIPQGQLGQRAQEPQEGGPRAPGGTEHRRCSQTQAGAPGVLESPGREGAGLSEGLGPVVYPTGSAWPWAVPTAIHELSPPHENLA